MSKFNFTGLHPAFLEAVSRHEPSIAFSLVEGRGRFVFLLFLATDTKGTIKWGKLELFILLARTQTMLPFDLYGNQKLGGDFTIYLKASDERAIRAELGIGDNATGPAFVLQNFLEKLNGMIPQSISLESKINVIKEDAGAIKTHCKKYVADATKVHFLTVKQLPVGHKPREETLRKLYMLNADTDTIASLIRQLKQARWTACWTATPPNTDAFADAFIKLSSALSGK